MIVEATVDCVNTSKTFLDLGLRKDFWAATLLIRDPGTSGIL